VGRMAAWLNADKAEYLVTSKSTACVPMNYVGGGIPGYPSAMTDDHDLD